MTFALLAETLFDGDEFRKDCAVVIEDGRIAAITAPRRLDAGMTIHKLEGGLLAPGFIDVQVNGGGGTLFNADPTVEGVRRIAEAHRRHGTTGLLPTVITDAPAVLDQALDAIATARRQQVPGILGIHVEGPFIDPKRKGAHDEKYIRTLTSADIDTLGSADCGRLMLTLAPNRVPAELIARLVARRIFVSLGHAEAHGPEIAAALAAGASAFTHLFNAMSQMTGREPGMVGMGLADRRSFCGLIADGWHVEDTVLHVALAAKPRDRFMLISDAMPPAAGGPDFFTLQGREVRRINGRLQLDDGTLAGSNLTMDEAVRYCTTRLGVPLIDTLRMASLNPAAFLKHDHELGRIVPGYRANLVHLGDDLKVMATWIDGK